MQLDELRSYCVRRNWSVVSEFLDEGVSGSKESRPALNRLFADAKRRKFDAVLVYRYDRFARSLRQLVNALSEFDALGIHFVSLHEGVDTSTPNGRLVFGIFASIAEFERQLIIARTKSGMQAAKARGKQIGRPKVKGQRGTNQGSAGQRRVMGSHRNADRHLSRYLPAGRCLGRPFCGQLRADSFRESVFFV